MYLMIEYNVIFCMHEYPSLDDDHLPCLGGVWLLQQRTRARSRGSTIWDIEKLFALSKEMMPLLHRSTIIENRRTEKKTRPDSFM